MYKAAAGGAGEQRLSAVSVPATAARPSTTALLVDVIPVGVPGGVYVAAAGRAGE